MADAKAEAARRAALLVELDRIARDPEETPKRRRIAQRAIDADMAGSGPLAAISIPGGQQGYQRTTSGSYEKTEANYNGHGRN